MLDHKHKALKEKGLFTKVPRSSAEVLPQRRKKGQVYYYGYYYYHYFSYDLQRQQYNIKFPMHYFVVSSFSSFSEVHSFVFLFHRYVKATATTSRSSAMFHLQRSQFFTYEFSEHFLVYKSALKINVFYLALWINLLSVSAGRTGFPHCNRKDQPCGLCCLRYFGMCCLKLLLEFVTFLLHRVARFHYKLLGLNLLLTGFKDCLCVI